MSETERISRALEFAPLGTYDGDHHKAWAIDQMVRALTGCPMVRVDAVDAAGRPDSYEKQGESPEYRQWVAAWEEDHITTWEVDGEQSEWRPTWKVGIAP